nr:GNAT family N-acetyltransferase [Nocardioides luti]
MTDLLGVCTAWGDGRCVVQPESGEPVTIALADVVSGKPVPPRPPVRHRVSPLAAQTRALALWPDLETEPVGDWLLRRSPTASARRANSVLAFEPSGVEGDYERVVAFYASRTGRPIAAVLPESAEDALFRGHGWVLESHDADTLFQLAGVAQVRRGLRAGGSGSPGSSGSAGGSVEVREEGGLAVARLDDRASGVAAYADDWVGFRSIEVSPEHRRRGHGLAIMAALLEWGAEQGATTAYLQVLGDNVGARALYERLGFATHHAYRYLAPASEPV